MERDAITKQIAWLFIEQISQTLAKEKAAELKRQAGSAEPKEKEASQHD